MLVGKTALRFLRWPHALATAIVYLCWYLLLKNDIVSPQYTSYYLIFLSGFAIAALINEFYLRKIQWYLPRQSNRALAWIIYCAFYFPSLIIADGKVGLHINVTFFTLFTILTICMVLVPRIMTKQVTQLYDPLNI